MAGAERVVSELVVQGASKFVQDFAAAGQAVSSLFVVQESVGVRQRVLYDTVAKAAEVSAQRQADASRRAADAAREAQEQQTNVVQRGVSRRLALIRDEASQQARNGLVPRGGDLTRRAFDSARENLRTSRESADVLQKVRDASNQVTEASNKKTKAIVDQSGAETRAKSSGITYLSVLSAIHAASFLASNRTFTLAGSFVTLGLAFGKMGGVAAGVGLALGGLLAIFNAITNAMNLIQQAAITTATALAKVVVTVTAVLGAAGVQGVKLAADLESQLALIQAVSGATVGQLRQLVPVITEVAAKFGISSAQVASGASLFIRAGGDITQAINGATEAVTQLVVASAGELQAAEAAVAVSAGIKQFALSGDEAVRVANALTAAAQASALSFTGVTQAFIQAAPGARTLGISLEDTAAGIAILGNELVKGTISGTAFKQFLLDLINPSKQSRDMLNSFGISVQTSTGAIRPFSDVLFDLNKALGDQAVETGKVSAAQRANALAVIFGSRASLAANILTREGAAGLATFRKEMENVTAVKVADILLLPLNKQLEVLKTNVELAGEAFGAPLLQPIKNAVVEAINFVKGFKDIATVIGQAVSVIATGQGFEQLQQQISAIADPRVATFFIELVNTGRNVADVIRNQIIPAIRDAATAILSFLTSEDRLSSVPQTFEGINRAVQAVGATIAVLIRQAATLVTEFINAEGKGGELRKSLEGIATTIATTFIPKLITMTVFIATAVAIMSRLGAAILNTGKTLEEFGLRVQKGLAISRGDLAAAKEFDAQIDNVKNTGDKLKETLAGLADVGTAQKNVIIQIFEDLAGEIPTILSNLNQELEEQNKQRQPAPAVTTEGFAPPDANALKRAGDRVVEAGRDVVRRLENIREDAATRANEILDHALERMEDIFEKADEQLKRLARDTKERIDDLNDSVTQRRDDRSVLENFRRSQEDQLRIRQRALDVVERIEQRATEDTEKLFDRQQQAAERVFTRLQQDAERAFSHVQRVREQALQDAQSSEEKALQKTLDEEARIRQEQRELQAAATPEDRAKVQKQHAQAADDRKFEEKQQAALDQLKKQHENASRASAKAAEEEQTSFKRSQEDVLLQFRQKQEEAALRFRRGLEDTQHVIRLSREDELFNIRRQHEQALQDQQDRLEDDATKRQIIRINREADERRQEIERTRDVQVRELETGVLQQLTAQISQVDRQIRNTIQGFEDSLDNLEPDVKQNLLPAITSIRNEIQKLVNGITEDLQLNTDQVTTRLGAEREFGLARTNVGAGAGANAGMANVQTVGVLTALNFIMPPAFSSTVAEAVRLGVIQAWGDQPLVNINQINQNAPIVDDHGFEELLQNSVIHLARSIRP